MAGIEPVVFRMATWCPAIGRHSRVSWSGRSESNRPCSWLEARCHDRLGDARDGVHVQLSKNHDRSGVAERNRTSVDGATTRRLTTRPRPHRSGRTGAVSRNRTELVEGTGPNRSQTTRLGFTGEGLPALEAGF